MAVCPVHFRTPSRFERMRPGLLSAASLAGIAALASVLRFYELGLRTVQGAETTASLIASQVARGDGYEQLPVTHGPFHYFVTAAAFRAFGTSDATARAMPALFGVLLALLPLFCARQLGRTGSIAAAALLAVSPTLLYYSRFAGPDVYLASFSLAAAMTVLRYLAQPQRAWLYLLAAMLAFMLVTTEMALVMVAIFATYLHVRSAEEFIAQAAEPEADARPTHYDVLGVPRDASVREVRAAYRAALARTADRAERETFTEAHRVLTAAARREAYDRRLAQRELAAARQAASGGPGVLTRGLLLATAGVIALAWPFVAPLRRRLRLKGRPAAADAFVVVTMLTLPFYGPLVEKLPFVGDRGFKGQDVVYVIGGTTHAPGGELPVMLITLGVLFAVAGVVGLAWKWHAWAICWSTFYGITLTMFTGLFTDRGGVWTGLWGTLDYWWRPEAAHADGPAYYYAMLLTPYELLPIAAAIAGAGALLLRGGWRDRTVAAGACALLAATAVAPAWLSPVAHHRVALALVITCGAVLALRIDGTTKFLAFWAVASSLAFSAIGRKEPWLAVHIALPLALLAARLLDRAVTASELLALSLAMPAPRRLAQVGVLAVSVVAAAFTVRTGTLAAWGHGSVPQLAGALASRDHGDTPIELVQPDRVAPDVREVRAAVERAAAASGQGRDIPIALDTSYSAAQGWLWYLREYPNLRIEDMRRGYQVPAGAIAIFDARNRDRVRVDGASAALTFTRSWSFPAGDPRLSARDVAADLASAGWWSKWARYVLDRTSVGTLDAQTGVAYFPVELSAAALPHARQSAVLASTVAPEPTGPIPPEPAPAP